MERRYPPVQIRLYRSVYTPRFSAGNRVELKKEKKERKGKERGEKKNAWNVHISSASRLSLPPPCHLDFPHPSNIILQRGYPHTARC